MATVKIRYSAFSNVSYNYEGDTGLESEEWDALSLEEQNEIIAELLWEDIDSYDVRD